MAEFVRTLKRVGSRPLSAVRQGAHQIKQEIIADLDLPTNLFESARLKLTAFYFAILIVFCLVLTFGVRAITSYELDRGTTAERGIVHRLLNRYYDGDGDTQENPFQGPGMPGDQYFINNQQQQDQMTRSDLNRDFFVFDVALLAAGAFLSYWYAGRTLMPIAELHEQQKRFTSDASHELRTPLASMRLENEVFLRQKEFTEQEARDQIASNLEEVERLEKLANNLLALSKYEEQHMSHAPVVVGELVAEAIDRVKLRKDAEKITFVATDVMPAHIDVNRESVVELLAILLDNAVKYGPKDGRVEIMGVLRDDTYTLAVRDHGGGIAEEDLPFIFDRMYRGDKARSSKVSGHGIGLSLAMQIAKANDAMIQAGNAPGGGAVFKVIFA